MYKNEATTLEAENEAEASNYEPENEVEAIKFGLRGLNISAHRSLHLGSHILSKTSEISIIISAHWRVSSLPF